MKNKIKTIAVVVIFAFIGFMVYSIALRYMEKEALRKRISIIPSFRFERLDNGFFSDSELENTSVIFQYFNSTCSFCQIEATAIKDRIEEFKDIQLVFISTEEKKDIKNFAKEYGLYEHANVIFLHDSNMGFSRIFGVNTVPVTFLYNNDRQFIKEFKGAVKTETMLEAFQKDPNTIGG